jgi:hypothetical protein
MGHGINMVSQPFLICPTSLSQSSIPFIFLQYFCEITPQQFFDLSVGQFCHALVISTTDLKSHSVTN